MAYNVLDKLANEKADYETAIQNVRDAMAAARKSAKQLTTKARQVAQEDNQLEDNFDEMRISKQLDIYRKEIINVSGGSTSWGKVVNIEDAVKTFLKEAIQFWF